MLNENIFKGIGLLICSFILITSCNQSSENEKDTRKHFRNEKGLLVKRTFYEEEGKEANVLTEKTFKVENGDTVLHGYAKSFYQDGQLMGEEHYKDGVKHGVSQQFYSSGQVKHRGWIKNGKLDSTGLVYYEDGQMKAKGYFHKGKKIGEQLNYHQNGKIKVYSFYNPVGESVYIREYNASGELTNEEGTKNTQLIYKGEDAESNTGETLNVKIYAPTPPDCEVTLLVSIKDKNGQALIDKKPIAIKNGLAIYETELKEVGKYYFEATISFEDKATDEQQEYSNAFEYIVVNGGV